MRRPERPRGSVHLFDEEIACSDTVSSPIYIPMIVPVFKISGCLGHIASMLVVWWGFLLQGECLQHLGETGCLIYSWTHCIQEPISWFQSGNYDRVHLAWCTTTHDAFKLRWTKVLAANSLFGLPICSSFRLFPPLPLILVVVSVFFISSMILEDPENIIGRYHIAK